MTGLQKILKRYGRIKAADSNGKTVVWIWDYKLDIPRLESEMTKDEMAESERAKWKLIKEGK